MRSVITTYTDREVGVLDLRQSDVSIEDVAHHLALCNRFAGGTRYPISVAQHSVYVSMIAQATTDQDLASCNEDGRRAGLQGLLHDASEAYLGDVTKWLKESDAMAGYRKAESAVQTTIFKRFGCPTEMLPEVEEADRLMVRLEFKMGYGRWIRSTSPLYDGPLTEEELARIGDWRFITWDKAETAFLVRFRELTR